LNNIFVRKNYLSSNWTKNEALLASLLKVEDEELVE